MTIRSWNCDDTRRVFDGEKVAKWSTRLGRKAERKLRMLHAAISIVDLRIPPGNALEKLEPKSSNRWSIRINRQWRICFVWRNGDAYHVEIVDYH